MKTAATSFCGLALAIASPAPAGAVICDTAKPVPIRIAHGERCWRYDGKAAQFFGTFRQGQHIRVSSVGVVSVYGEKNDKWISAEKRNLEVTLPSGAHQLMGDEFIAPATGTYKFVFYACSMGDSRAMWDREGIFIACAS